MPDDGPAPENGAPLISWRGAVVALVVAVLLCWPVWLTGYLFAHPDTTVYLRGGATMWGFAVDILGGVLLSTPPGEAIQAAPGSAAPAQGDIVQGGTAAGDMGAGGDATPAPVIADGDGMAVTARSFTSSFWLFALYSTAGPLAAAAAQTWVAVFTAFALITRQALARWTILGIGAVWLGLLTPLPWVSSLLLPDIMAAAVILFGAVLAFRWDALSRNQKIVLVCLAALAASSHYGHVPLAAAVIGLGLAVRVILCRRLGSGALAAAVATVAFGPVIHLGASSAALEEPSMAPLRLPFLLARSIDDGPAYWYLQEACPEAPLALCEILGDDIPSSVHGFLFTERGIWSVTPEQRQRILDEERQILVAAFLNHPLPQVRAFLGNVVEQMAMVNLPGRPYAELDANFARGQFDGASPAARLRAEFAPVVIWGTWLGLGVAATAMVLSRPDPRHVWLLGFVLAGLLANAAVFGGLSAPAPRYQSRVIWLPILVMVIAIAESRAAPRTRRQTA